MPLETSSSPLGSWRGKTNDHAPSDLAYNKEGVLAKALILEITWRATEIDKKYTLYKAAQHGMYVHSSKAFLA